MTEEFKEVLENVVTNLRITVTDSRVPQDVRDLLMEQIRSLEIEICEFTFNWTRQQDAG